jgi:hypothetical protein
MSGSACSKKFDVDPPPSAQRWAVTVDDQALTYGQVHDLIHRDIAIGNDYRKERLKLLIALATGVFALTVTFHKDLFHDSLTRADLWLLLVGWAALVVSLIAGIFHFQKWEDFYLEHRARGNALWRYRIAATEAEKRDARISFNRSKQKIDDIQDSYKKCNAVQTWGLIIGLALIGTNVANAGFQVTSEAASKPPLAGTTTEKNSPNAK